MIDESTLRLHKQHVKAGLRVCNYIKYIDNSDAAWI